MVKVTKKEAAVLDHVARNCYGPMNYGKPENFDTDVSSIWAGNND